MIQSLDRAMTILSILEQKNTASVTEIAEELGVNKSTVSRLMETLKNMIWCRQILQQKSMAWALKSYIWEKA